MTTVLLLLYLLGIAIAGFTGVWTALRYRYLPGRISMKPDYGELAPFAPKFMIWLLPVGQVAFVILPNWFGSTRAAHTSIGSAIETAVFTDLILGALAWTQVRWIRRQDATR